MTFNAATLDARLKFGGRLTLDDFGMRLGVGCKIHSGLHCTI